VPETNSSFPAPDVSKEHPESADWVWNDGRPFGRPFAEYMTQEWGPSSIEERPHPAVEHTRHRRERVHSLFPDHVLVIPSGGAKIRANDQEYNFRPGSDLFWLSACDDTDAVLVVHPDPSDELATLYLNRRFDYTTHAFFSNARQGELWVGPRRSLDDAASRWGITTAPLDTLEKDLAGWGLERVVVRRGYDERVDAALAPSELDAALARTLSQLRLVKDDYEIARLQEAVDATVLGFEDVVRALPTAIGHSERVVEGVFNLRARTAGNDTGYRTIAAAGAHATILHWTRNDGELRSGDLLLLDAGVEVLDLYTSDVTRTLPISGTFTREQREIYDIVYAATQAGIAAVRPGARGQDQHRAAMRCLAEGLYELGILDVGPEVSLRPEFPLTTRYIVCGTSHMLGLDVHDCTAARDTIFPEDPLEVGNVLTVEPGLYFQANDLTVPPRYRGIGIRIEEDVVVTPEGSRVMTSALPSDPDEIEAWMKSLFAQPAPHVARL
jgi:Xaa-Pro aminopeptidase